MSDCRHRSCPDGLCHVEHTQRYDDALQMASYESGLSDNTAPSRQIRESRIAKTQEPRGNVVSTALICAALACAFYGALYWLVAL